MALDAALPQQLAHLVRVLARHCEDHQGGAKVDRKGCADLLVALSTSGVTSFETLLASLTAKARIVRH